MDERDQRITDLESQLDHLTARHSVLAHFIETIVANMVLHQPLEEVDKFLIAMIAAEPWTQTEEGPGAPRPDQALRMQEYTSSMATKIRRLVAEAKRQTGEA